MKVIKASLLISLSLFLIPQLSYGQGQEKAIGGMIAIFLSILFALTALSAYFLVKLYNQRLGSSKVKAILISLVLVFIGTLIILLSGPHPDNAQDPYSQKDAMERKNVGYLILIPNLLIMTAAVFIKSYASYEALLGRLDEDRRVITWVSLKKIKTNQVELAYHKVMDKWQGRFDDIYNFSPYMDGRTSPVLRFENFESAAEDIRNTYELEKLRFVRKGKLKAEYRRLLSSEKSTDKNQIT
ncbi:hypothetical protein H9Q13_10115 [Pontibacter sp. JH31]|uniref:Uncharacterized protein n=1 Tax=Pontibacter aquaedesilientis TaxID=2766980 RepID=A0ABR7XGY7_9BACT|nr:hypothetical protein [Pontibacter aquaedesilientis]MBD1397521.1 hypothetical protein [Pontibacter aquaedesilientis]